MRALMSLVLILMLCGCGSNGGALSGSSTTGAAGAETDVALRIVVPVHSQSAKPAVATVRAAVLDARSGQLIVPAVEQAAGEGTTVTLTVHGLRAGDCVVFLTSLDAAGGAVGHAWQQATVSTGVNVVTLDPVLGLTRLEVTPSPARVALGTRLALSATATLSDRSAINVTGAAAWTIAEAGVASVSTSLGSAGVVDALGVGQTTARATLSGASGASPVIVLPKGLTALTVTPAASTVALGLPAIFTATGVFDDGSTQDLTRTVRWASGDTTVASVDASGRATTSRAGTTTVTATFLDLSAQATLRVDPHVVVSLTVTPTSASIKNLLDTLQMHATATYSDGLTSDVTSDVTWSSSPIVALSSAGLLRGRGQQGTAHVTASLGTLTGEADVSLHGSILVVDDFSSGFAQVDDMAGNGFVRGLEADLTGCFNSPFNVALDAQGRVYVADEYHARIVRFDDMSGRNFVAYGSPGAGQGQFVDPANVAVDRHGRIYVADNGAHRVVRIDDMDGNGWVALGHQGSGVNQFSYPIGLFVDDADHIYVGDTQGLVRFDDMTGANWTRIPFGFPFNISVDAAGHIYGATSSNLRRIDDMSGANPLTFGAGVFSSTYGLALGPTGRIYVADADGHRIAALDDMSGTNLVFYGTQGSGAGQFQSPTGVAVDAQNRIFVADDGNDRIVRVDDMSGTGFTSYGRRSPLDVMAFGANVDGDGRLYLADYQQGVVVRIDDRKGTGMVRSQGPPGQPFDSPGDVAFDSRGRIYVTDTVRGVVIRMDDLNGTNAVSFGSSGSGVNQFQGPVSIHIDGADRIYVADSAVNRVVRFDDMTGANWTEFNGVGSPVGAFSFPTGITVDATGRIYVADQSNSRLVRMDDMAGTGCVAFAVPEAGSPTHVAVDGDGRIYFSAYFGDPGLSPAGVFRMDDFSGTHLVSMRKGLSTASHVIVR